MTTLTRLASLIYNRPLLVHPNTAAVVDAALGARFGTDGAPDLSALAPDASRFRGTPDSNGMRYRVERGTAIVPVLGELCNRGAWVGASSGLTSYEGIAAQLSAALADPTVYDILLDMNSPGGEAVGAFECAAAVAAAAEQKPVWAFVNGMAASAGYALASGADRIVVTPSGIVGSIGVVMMHMDQSKRLEKAGVAVTLLFAGDHKVDGHSFGPLPDSVKDDLKAEIDAFYGMFVQTVADGREMDADAVRATQARCFMGADAVAAGLADEVGTLDAVLASLQAARLAGTFNPETAMTDTIARAAHDAALAQARTDSHASGILAGKADGAAALAAAEGALATAKADGAKAERERVAGILGHAEAKDRAAMARHLAFKTDMAVDAAGEMLAASAKEAAPGAGLGARMNRVPNPAVQHGDAGDEGSTAAAAWGDVMATVNKEAERRF